MSDDRKDLPPVSAPNFLEKVRETLSIYMGNRGDKLDRGITLRDLTDSGIVTLRPGFLTGGGRTSPIGGIGNAISGAYEPDLTPPPTPTGFMASAAISNIFIEHAAPLYPQGHGHAKTIVYGATWVSGALPVFGDAVKITEFSGTVFAHPTNPATTWHLWIKWVTVDGVESTAPAGGTNGLVVTTGQDVAKMVTAMTGPGNPFTILAVDTVIDGVTYPAGTYTTKALIFDAQISTAKIKNLAVDDAKIASLSVSKLVAGSIAVGQYAQSTGYVAGSAGWRINGDGLAEFSNVVVRGTVYASAGNIGGNTIDSTGMQSPNYVMNSTGWRLNSDGSFYAKTGTFSGSITGASGTFTGSITGASGTFGGNLHGGQFTTGAYTGYAWPAAGNYGSYLGPSGLLIGNANNGKYLQLTQDGNIYTPGFDVVDGVMSIKTLNVINTANIAGNAVTSSNASSGASTASTNITVPAYQTMRIAGIGHSASSGVVEDLTDSGATPTSGTATLYIDGVLRQSGSTPGINRPAGTGSYTAWGPMTLVDTVEVYGGASGKSVTVTVSSNSGSTTVVTHGMLR